MVFGGAGATVTAAQASGPGDALYPIKIASEDVRLALTTDSQQMFDLLLQMAQERFEEIDEISEEGESVPTQVTTRLQEHFQLALQCAANLDDEGLTQAMERVRVMTQQQSHVLQQLQTQNPGNTDEALQLTEQIVARIRVAAEDGLEDPITFRQRHGANRPDTAPEQPAPVPGGGDPAEGTQGPGGPQGTGKGNGPK